MKNPHILHGRAITDIATEQALSKRAHLCTLLNFESTGGVADFFLICEGSNTIQNKAIADAIDDALSAKNTKPWRREGYDEGRWILLDYSDVVIHIMLPDLREFYDLEHLWEQAEREEIVNPDYREDEEEF